MALLHKEADHKHKDERRNKEQRTDTRWKLKRDILLVS